MYRGLPNSLKLQKARLCPLLTLLCSCSTPLKPGGLNIPSLLRALPWLHLTQGKGQGQVMACGAPRDPSPSLLIPCSLTVLSITRMQLHGAS
jgi:hypothetical protein